MEILSTNNYALGVEKQAMTLTELSLLILLAKFMFEQKAHVI